MRIWLYLNKSQQNKRTYFAQLSVICNNTRMGFPMWTLIGMGVTAVLALLMTIFAYLAQTPRALMRLGLAGYRLDLRVKLFTGYALASLILMLGFFLAGVPIENGSSTADVAMPTTAVAEVTASGDTGAMGALPPTAVATNPLPELPETNTANDSTAQTPSSGAFGGPPTSSDEVATEEVTATATPNQAGPSPTPGENVTAETAVPATTNSSDNTATIAPTATATATPFPTATPTPTITPTPIEGITGTINTNGSTLWVRRSPGGQQLIIVQDNEVVLVENGRANQGGILWREIRTVSGILGWVQAEFLEE
jgi:cytoskeletal protein RodZ